MKVFQLLFVLLPCILAAQNPVPPTTFKERMDGLKKKELLRQNSLLNNIKFTSIGPTVMSGRVVDLDVNPADPTVFYVAFASGGLWKTVNNGNSFEPVFDNQVVITIGDIFVDWKNNETIWIGSGESNSSRSSYSGVGVFKSSDGGKTWEHKGLEETHHIGRILVSPADPNTIYVAALGHLYSPNKERGIFKSADGGKTWKQTLFIDVNTGVVDITFDPKDPKIMYAASWYKTRKAWNFEEAGKSSAIYKSTDGGDKWSIISTAASGFPSGDGVGRIGLTVSPSNSSILYAFLDNQFQKKDEKSITADKITKDLLRSISKDNFLKLEDGKLDGFLKDNEFPEKYTAVSVKDLVKSDKVKPVALVEYLEDANSLLFDTKITGAELYRSDDGGKTWKKTHDKALDGMYHTYGYYFGNVRVSPVNPDEVYLVGFILAYSKDGGKTFTSINRDNTHVDYHALWIDPNKAGHLICGNDGGLNISYDNGKTWMKCNTPAVGQFYAINYDMATPYNVYGGLQDNGAWAGPSNYSFSYGWYQEGEYPYKSLMGGDGMQVMIDPRDNNTVYTGYQFGNYFRINKTSREPAYITPQHELGERPYRWNWQTPIWLSIHNPDILYMGSNKFHRTFNKGKDFKTLSGDLTSGGKKGDVAFGTLTTIHESPMKFGLIYVGSDDGLIHVSKDGGYTWSKAMGGLPGNMWVSRVWASTHKESRVYCSLNAYRWDNFTPYIFVSDDYGSSWKRIGTDLPMEPVNVVKEDPKNEKVIYAGTDNGCYVSIDMGKTFMIMMNGLPNVAVHDLAVHPRDNELILGTHGRSIYKAKVDMIQELRDTVLSKDLHIYAIKKQGWNKNWGKSFSAFDEVFKPEMNFSFWSKSKTNINWEIKTEWGQEIYSKTVEVTRGINFLEYDLSTDLSALAAWEDQIKSKNKDKKDIPMPVKAENGMIYLVPGKYILTIADQGSGAFAMKEFEITGKPK